MKRQAILKVIIALIMSVILLARPMNIFAVTSNPTDLNDFWEDQGSLEDLGTETTTPGTKQPETTTPETPQPETTNPETTNTNKDIPEAGVAEDTTMAITVIALVVIAIIAFKKVNELKNI